MLGRTKLSCRLISSLTPHPQSPHDTNVANRPGFLTTLGSNSMCSVCAVPINPCPPTPADNATPFWPSNHEPSRVFQRIVARSAVLNSTQFFTPHRSLFKNQLPSQVTRSEEH